MRENISSTGGVNSSTIPAMLKSSSRRLFSRHALRVQQHVPIISEKLRNFRLPDGCFFSLFFPLWFSGCSVPHDCRGHRGAHSCPPHSQPSFQNRLLAPIVFISAPCSHMRTYPPNPNQHPTGRVRGHPPEGSGNARLTARIRPGVAEK